MNDPLEEAAKASLRTNQVTLLTMILVMLNEVNDLEEARANIKATIQALIE